MKKRMLSLLLAASLLGGTGVLPAGAAEAESPTAQAAPTLNFEQTISAGEMHMAVIKEDGSLWTWGYADNNTLGVEPQGEDRMVRWEEGALSEHIFTGVPQQVPLDKPVVSVEAGTTVTNVITADHELWNWGGHNAYGALGREITSEATPLGRVMGGIQSVSSGERHTLVLSDAGTMWAWGSNEVGQLGNGGKGDIFHGAVTDFVYERLPVRVLDNVISVQAGNYTSFAVLADNSLWGWGNNNYNNLSFYREPFRLDERPDESLFGTRVEDVHKVREKVLEMMYGNGEIWQNVPNLEEHIFIDYAQMTPVKMMDGVAKIIGSDFNRPVILKTDGTLWSTGNYEHVGEDEEGEWLYAYGIQRVLYTDDIDDVVDGACLNGNFAVIRSDGSLWTWGFDNWYGQLGWGWADYEEDVRKAHKDENKYVPRKVMEDVVSVTMGDMFMAALKSDGTLWTWGVNGVGQLGNGEGGIYQYCETPTKVMEGVALPASYTQSRQTPQVVTPDEAFVQLAAIRQEQAEWDTTPWTQRAMQIPDFACWFNGNAYAFYAWQDCTWDQAENYCLSVGGHLATITTREEQEFVSWVGDPHWIGARRNQYGGWSWVTGESWSYNAWHPGENDNYGGFEGSASVWGDGWCDVSNNVSGTVGFVCEWETAGRRLPTPPAPIYSVTFCIPENAQLNTIRKQVVQGETYGWLPTPTLEGWSFVGWFTQPDGGRMITSSTQVNQNESIFLYAKWNKTSGGPTVPALSYSFGNNSYDMNYDENYKIPLDRYVALFGDNQFARSNYASSSVWGGSCSGMVSSALMLYMGGATGVSIPSFRAGAVSPAELQLGDVSENLGWTLRDFIEVMQLAQRSPLVKASKTNDYCGMVQAVQNFDFNGTSPVLISIKGPRDANGSRPGHAVVGLGAWRKNETTDCITIYDPNWPGSESRFIELYRDSQGRYCGWRYDLGDRGDLVWGSAYDNAPIYFGFIDCFYEVWNNRGTSYVCSGKTMSVNSNNASIYDYAGNLVATIRDGEVNSLRSDILPVFEPEEGSAGSSEGVSLWVPEEYFSVVNEDEGVETLSVTVSGMDSAVSVSTSADRALVYAGGEDSVAMVNGDGESYEMVFRSGQDGEVRLSGTARADMPAMAAQLSGALSGVGLEPESGAARTTVLDVVTSTATGGVSATFADVSGESYYAPAVQWAAQTGVTSGTAQGIFQPARSCTRAEAVTLLWRAAGCPASGTEVTPFEDVTEGDYFYQAALWAVGAGLTVGADAAHFSPEGLCSNREFLTLLWQFLGCPGRDSELAGCEDAAQWALDRGMLEGTGAPEDMDAPCLRQDAAIFLYRALA